MARTKSNGNSAHSSATIGFEAKLWLTADKLRNNMDAAEYKLLLLLEAPLTPTAIWDRAKHTPEIGTYGRFVLVLDFLYAVSAIDLADGLVVKRELS